MTLDPITLEILRDRLDEVVATMEQLLYHSGYSPILRESGDGSACILDNQGHPVADPGSAVHLVAYRDTLQAILRRYGDDMSPGDSFLINDPYVCGVAHVPDMALVTPVFYQGKRIAFCASISHKSDVGGLVPGSCGAGAREILHEGILIPGVRYWTEQGVNPDVEAILRQNSRAPEELLGDIRAQVGCTRVGVRRLIDLCDEYGVDTVTESFDLLIRRAERLLKQELRRWPDGEQEAEGLRDNEVVKLDRPLRFHVRVRKQGDDVEIDFSGSDPQSEGPVNIRRQSSEMGALLALVASLDPKIPLNDGLLRVVRFVNPPGRVTNVQYPGPVNNYFGIMHLVYECVMQALARFRPELAVAAAGFRSGAQALGYRGSLSTGRVQYELLSTSLGGTAVTDGVFGVTPMTNSTPAQAVEILETEYPLQVTRFEPLVDSAGAGKHRGGSGFIREYRVLTDATYTLRSGGFVHGDWGVAGGRGPSNAEALLNPGTDHEERLPAMATRDLRAGDVIQVRVPGGWGWGNPLERDPQSVADDVRDGLVSRTAAREVYGVILDATGGTVDESATADLRRSKWRMTT